MRIAWCLSGLPVDHLVPNAAGGELAAIGHLVHGVELADEDLPVERQVEFQLHRERPAAAPLGCLEGGLQRAEAIGRGIRQHLVGRSR